MLTFYKYLMTYRGKNNPDDQSRLADWVFLAHDFPKHSIKYNEVSDYLEMNSPFSNALVVFDDLWESYLYKRQ